MAILWVCPNELFLEFGDEPKKNKVGIIQVFFMFQLVLINTLELPKLLSYLLPPLSYQKQILFLD